MGRYKLDDGDTKAAFGAMTQKKKIALIGSRKCKEIAETAIDKEYEKLLKSKTN